MDQKARFNKYQNDGEMASVLARSIAKQPVEGSALELAADLRSSAVHDVMTNLLWVAESPIEALMAAAICRVWDAQDIGLTGVNSGWEADVSEEERTLWRIGAQVGVGVYRADFLLAMVRPLATVSAVIECDGHDFHERTKDQAKRDRRCDREMQTAGHLVMRFTGSEIYADPIARAYDVLVAMTREMGRRQTAHHEARWATEEKLRAVG